MPAGATINDRAAPPEGEAQSCVLPPAAGAWGERQHVPALDGLRGLAIIVVMVFHFLPYDPGDLHPAAKAHPSIRYMLLGAHAGQTGVDLFFVLSGFLITGILLDTRNHPRYFTNFYGRRTVRIFPLYYGVIFFTLFLPMIVRMMLGQPVTEDQQNQWWLWLYLTNVAVFLGVNVPAMHFWSLAVEEHFYLVWPGVVYMLNPRRLAVACVGNILAAIGIRAVLASYGLDTFYLTPCRMDVLGFGGLLAIASSRYGGLAGAARAARWGLLVVVAALIPVYLQKSGEADTLVLTMKHTLLAGFYSLLLIAAVGAAPGTAIHRFFTSRVIRSFGKYSYGLYVYHGLLRPLILDYLPLSESAAVVPFLLSALWRLMIATAVCYAVSWVSWHVYEKQFLKLKRYFSYRR
jgi:peptidoglycan/LPS O-acetylase OafA/YrhL